MTGSAVRVPLRWLDDAPPARLSGGATWGVPLPRGAVASVTELRLREIAGAPAGSGSDAGAEDAMGAEVAAQFWPLATWPDGSVKWAGVAIGALDAPVEYEVVSRAEASVSDRGPASGQESAAPRVTVRHDEDEVVVANGTLEIAFALPAHGPVDTIARRLVRDGRTVSEDVRLVSLLQDEVREDGGSGPRRAFRSRVTAVEVEQDGPVRAVVRVEGVHQEEQADRAWLPFTVRFVVMAGAAEVRLVHSVVWNGDAEHDFLAGLGVRADVPLRAAMHDRHVRLAGADGGFFAEAVRGLTGLRRDPGAEVRAAQVRGEATPPLAQWNPQVSERLELIPAWGDLTLTQLSADGFGIRKRTAPGHAWIDAGAGTRAEGYVAISDPTGGFGIGIRSFWQSHPGQLDLRRATGDRAELTAWLYAPEAQPMDVRFYHDGLGQDDFATQLEGLEITYEDYEPGFGDAHGVARTHELTLFAYAATPEIEDAAAAVAAVQRPPLLQPTPAHLHAVGVFGDWAPVDRSTSARAEIEDSIDFLLEFYLGQIDQRRGNGFWNVGDVMHAYDLDRHVWRYDVGGYAWDNSELSPDLWLWYSYLRTGRADVFRLAEAMTRHTGEVDVYHLGRWQGLGSRHNVQHWGCSAKQLRISSPIYRRIF